MAPQCWMRDRGFDLNFVNAPLSRLPTRPIWLILSPLTGDIAACRRHRQKGRK
jgi:hypothetical protein